MCGIAGFVGGWSGSDRLGTVGRMCDVMAHRGPDGSGEWTDKVATLGHRRLAIIDLTSAGAQPMVGASGAVISFNGEIYNYRELRAELTAAGERFQSDSDTEVLLRLFEREGERCLDRLVGMFAIAIWDPRRGRLFLARDRLGKKPLYYYLQDGRLAFASEIKALMTLPEIAKGAEIDPLAMSDFLSLGYILSPKTAFANIRRLPAAHFAWFRPDTGAWSEHEYWRLDEHFLAERIPYGPAARERFSALLDDAVRIRLRSDVPVGVFLSGGLDSSAVAAKVAALGASEVRAFCVGFEDASFDEADYARTVADHVGIPMTLLDNPHPDAELVSRLIWHCDEPFADTSMLPTYLLNRQARAHVTVALTGDGADEILAGYPTYRANEIYNASRHLPLVLTRHLSRLADKRLRPRYRKVGWDFKLRRFLRSHGLSRTEAHYSWRMIMSDADKQALMGEDMARACHGYSPFDTFANAFARVRGASFLDQTLYVDTKTWLQDDILTKADRMSMAASLEVRSPFLDHRMVELAAQLAPGAKMNARRQKIILKDVMAPSLPPVTIARRKVGFSAPTAALQRVSLLDSEAGEFFRTDFRLHPEREDVTFKGFVLATLGAWLHVLTNLRKTGAWRA